MSRAGRVCLLSAKPKLTIICTPLQIPLITLVYSGVVVVKSAPDTSSCLYCYWPTQRKVIAMEFALPLIIILLHPVSYLTVLMAVSKSALKNRGHPPF